MYLPPRTLLLRDRDSTIFKVSDNLEFPEIVSIDTDECDRIYLLTGNKYVGFDGEVYTQLFD